jgi:hypothetical protein
MFLVIPNSFAMETEVLSSFLRSSFSRANRSGVHQLLFPFMAYLRVVA